MNNNYQLINADTDSILISKFDMSTWTDKERKDFLTKLNSLFPEKISFEDDGYFPKVLVLKSKNYVLKDEKNKVKIKGSALRDQRKEKRLLDFIGEIVNLLLDDKKDDILPLYNKYILECFNIQDITLWAKKVAITSKILKCAGHEKYDKEEKKMRGLRANETKVYDALNGKFVQEGDKIYVFFKEDKTLSLIENFDGKDYDARKLIEKLYKTLNIFKNVIDMEQFPKYHLKGKAKLLDRLVNNNVDNLQ